MYFLKITDPTPTPEELHAQYHRHNRPRLIAGATRTTPVLLEEHVHSVHLSTGHAAA